MSERMRFAPVAWPQTADALGFSAPDASGLRALNGFAIRPEGDWLALVDRSPVVDDPQLREAELGTPGLWRIVRDGAAVERVHDLPPLRRESDAEQAPPSETLEPFLAWAAATRGGEVASDWSAPPRDEVEGWLAPARLHVRSGALLATGKLVHEPGRLALVFPELAHVPGELSSAREAWVDALLQDAGRRWRLVRFGVDADTRCVQAEIDLTGVPAAWARPFVQLSIEALAWAVEWLLSPITFLVDTSAASQALERHSFHSLTRSPRHDQVR